MKINLANIPIDKSMLFSNPFMSFDNAFNNVFDDSSVNLNKDTINKNFSHHEYNSKPTTIRQNINISLLDAYNGCKVPLNITRWIIVLVVKIKAI